MNKKRRELLSTNQVSRLATYSLGGYEQKVLLDGKKENNPVVLCLHGGPGFPVPFSAGCRGMFPEFTDHFIMAYWDQFGCGINNHAIDDHFSIDTFADMTVDLVKELKTEFPENPLILFGMSYGSVLAAKAAARVPELLNTVVIYGQILNQLFFNEEVYEALSLADLPPRVVKRLEMFREVKTHTPNDLKEMAAFIRKYTQGYQVKTSDKVPMGAIIQGFLQSPDYSLKDFMAVVKNGYMKNQSIWNELLQIDLTEDIERIQVPYRILQGDTDIVTSTKAVSQFVAESKNGCLSFQVIENSGHIPGSNGMNAVLAELIRLTNK